MNLNVYFLNGDGEFGMANVADVTDHQEAILFVKESLVFTGEGYTDPVLAVIDGGVKHD